MSGCGRTSALTVRRSSFTNATPQREPLRNNDTLPLLSLVHCHALIISQFASTNHRKTKPCHYQRTTPLLSLPGGELASRRSLRPVALAQSAPFVQSVRLSSFVVPSFLPSFLPCFLPSSICLLFFAGLLSSVESAAVWSVPFRLGYVCDVGRSCCALRMMNNDVCDVCAWCDALS